MTNILAISQIIISIILIILILLQERGSGLSGILGGESGSNFYQARRGLERFVFIGTIVFSILFAAAAILQLIY